MKDFRFMSLLVVGRKLLFVPPDGEPTAFFKIVDEALAPGARQKSSR